MASPGRSREGVKWASRARRAGGWFLLCGATNASPASLPCLTKGGFWRVYGPVSLQYAQGGRLACFA